MLLLPKLTVAAVFCSAVFAMAQTGPAPIQKNALAFDRFELNDNAGIERIRQAGNLSGKQPGEKEASHIPGWVEYDFAVAQAGWYSLDVNPFNGGHEFIVDGKDLYYGSGGTFVANVWLEAGNHMLRIQRTHYTGFAAITGWQLTPAGEAAENRISVRTDHRWKVIRQGESLPLIVRYGGLLAPVKLSLLIKKKGGREAVEAGSIDLPAGGGLQEAKLEIPGKQEGTYDLGWKLDGREPGKRLLPPIRYAVVDTTPVRPAEAKEEKRLVAEIDPVKQEPDYFNGGATRVIARPWGSYRESGNVGYLQTMNSTDPSWFAYKFEVDDPEALYWLEFDYPDDARRSFLVVARSDNSPMYAGPGTGPDTGREFSLTNRMQAMGIYFWPHSKNLRAVVMQPQNGLRAAVSKIRVYKAGGGLPPMPHPANGRDFIHWYEEGSSFMGFFGAQDKSNESVLLAADNWARIMAHMGASMLMPTFSIYQMGMYPSVYNPPFTDTNTFDAARVIELKCEKYGLKFAADFHPEGRNLKTPTALAKSADSIFQFDRYGKVWANGAGPKFNFLHPEIEAFALGLLGEFADRYGDSPAFDGVSIRLMGWQNTGLGNFDNLDWGYGDYTIDLFEHDTKTKIPVAADDPERFGKRYEWLMANARQAWIDWRCQKAAAFFAKVSQRVRAANPNAKVYLNDFLTPETRVSKEWYDKFLNGPKDAGIDPKRLAAVPGVELVNSTVSYGRRKTEEMDQRSRDGLIDPALNSILATEGKPSRFMTTQAYFEATSAVVPPKDLGYPEKTPHGWVSGCVNPGGRHILERQALLLAEHDAVSLGDGGNAYTVGQPLLRDFLKEYRALPQEKFQARPDARDPVAVWELPGEKAFLFYAVNRERFSVKVKLQFSSRPALKRLSNGEVFKTKGKSVQLTLPPYALVGFSAEAGTKIVKVMETVPEADLARVRSMTEWLRRLSGDVAAGKVEADLSAEQKSLLAQSAAEAESCLKEGRVWRARTLQEEQRLRDIYNKCSRIPPLLDQNGPLQIPDFAVSGSALFSKITSKSAELVDSEKISPDLAAQQFVVSPEGELTVMIEAPTDGKYQIRLGQLTGEGFATSAVKVDGVDVGTLSSRPEPVRPILALLPNAVALKKGEHRLSLSPVDGKRQGLLFLQLTPVYQDIVSNRWMAAGPFKITSETGKAASDAMTAAMANRVFAPETARDFTATLDTSDKPRPWIRLGSQDDFIDFVKVTGVGQGSIHYAVTYIASPEEREMAVAYSADYFRKIWLNNEVVDDGSSVTGGAPRKGQVKRVFRLKQGVNELLLKIGSGSGGNGFWMAVNNPGDLRFAPQGSSPGNQ